MKPDILHVLSAAYLGDYRIRVAFNDGCSGVVDLQDHLTGPVFLPLRDTSRFAEVKIEGHTLAWPNGADFAPEFLRGLLDEPQL
jgi:hypothetical protein